MHSMYKYANMATSMCNFAQRARYTFMYVHIQMLQFPENNLQVRWILAYETQIYIIIQN